MVRTARFAFDDGDERRQPLFTDLDNDLDDPCLELPHSNADRSPVPSDGSGRTRSAPEEVPANEPAEAHRQTPKAA